MDLFDQAAHASAFRNVGIGLAGVGIGLYFLTAAALDIYATIMGAL